MAAALRAMGVGGGDEVVVQAFTCVAVPEGVLACGATPVYADIESEGYNAGADQIARRINERTRAIVVQHTFGLPADIEAIVGLADRHGLPVIEDCCHTLTGEVAGRRLGTFGSAAFYSFEWGKPLVAGVGGSLIANDSALEAELAADYERLRSPSLARTARVELQYQAFRVLYRPRWYWAVRSAFRRLSRAGAAEGNFNTPEAGDVSQDFSLRMAGRLRRRARLAARGMHSDSRGRLVVERRYREAMSCADVVLPETHGFAPLARLPLRVTDKERVLVEAESRGLELADWYRTAIHPLSNEQASAVGYEAGSCPNAERRAREVVSLPTHAGVDARFIDQVAELFTPSVPGRRAA